MTRGRPTRILLIQLHHLGDVVLTTPTIRAARRAFPDARIDFVTGALGAQALEKNPHLDHVIVQPRLRDLYAARYDYVGDMHSVPRTAVFTLATRAEQRIGIRGRGPRNLAYTQILEREERPIYMARQKKRLLAPLGIEDSDVSLEIVVDEADRAWARSLLGKAEGGIVAISPVSRHEYKQWGAANWAAVADELANQGLRILITSGPGEVEQARAVAETMTHPAIWNYGATTVRQLTALYEQCALWAGNDGGPKHLAVAAGTPTVSVVRRQLGPVWSDSEDPRQIALSSGSDDLTRIRPEDVLDACSRLMR